MPVLRVLLADRTLPQPVILSEAKNLRPFASLRVTNDFHCNCPLPIAHCPHNFADG